MQTHSVVHLVVTMCFAAPLLGFQLSGPVQDRDVCHSTPDARMVALNFSMSGRVAVSDALAHDDATPPSVGGA